MSSVTSVKAPEDILSDTEFWLEFDREFALRLAALSRRIIVEGARAAESVGIIVDFDAVHREALYMARTTESMYWATMNQATRSTLSEALQAWFETGLGKRGLPDLIDAIEPMFGRERAKRIAPTETTRLFAAGNQLAAMRDDAAGGLQWQTVGDERVCPICGPRDGQIYPKETPPECPAHVR